jgi:hypothetical protein
MSPAWLVVQRGNQPDLDRYYAAKKGALFIFFGNLMYPIP